MDPINKLGRSVACGNDPDVLDCGGRQRDTSETVVDAGIGYWRVVTDQPDKLEECFCKRVGDLLFRDVDPSYATLAAETEPKLHPLAHRYRHRTWWDRRRGSLFVGLRYVLARVWRRRYSGDR